MAPRNREGVFHVGDVSQLAAHNDSSSGDWGRRRSLEVDGFDTEDPQNNERHKDLFFGT